MDPVFYIPVPCVCAGIITSRIEDNETYEVSIYDSPVGELNGPIYASLIYSPGSDGNYKQGDFVRVLMQFTFGGTEHRFTDAAPGTACYILGLFNERSIANLKVENPASADDKDRIRMVNKKSGAGVVVTDSGKVLTQSGGSIYDLLDPFGFGIHKNAKRTMAQNYHRIISHNAPFYLSREHFGLYMGKDQNDELTRAAPEDIPVIFRRFLTASKGLDDWVSTCEGTYAPWVGANNNVEEVEPSKQVLLSKVVNKGTSRFTVEIGEPGDEFVNLRVDDVTVGEKALPAGAGATPAVVGNRLKLTISDKGAVDLRASGEAVPGANPNALHLSVDEQGNLTIHAKGKIILSHGDNDESVNSLVMDPAGGIDITAKNGFRVNGKTLVTESFLDWMNQNAAQLCQVTSIGGPAPIHPLALPGFQTGLQQIMDANGFKTTNTGPPASGIILDDDLFTSV